MQCSFRHVAASMMVVSLAVSGCGQNDVVSSTLAGAGIGGTVGAVVGNATGNTRTGALIGAGFGAAAGFAVGQYAAEKRRQYNSEAEFLDGEIAEAKRGVSQKRREVRGLGQASSTNARSIRTLRSQAARNQNVSAALRSTSAKVQSDARRSSALIEALESQSDYADVLVRRANADRSSSAAAKRRRVSELRAERAKYQQILNELYGVDRQLNSQAEALRRLS